MENKKSLQETYDQYLAEYNQVKSQNFSLDMSRGKPSAEQLDLSAGLLNILKNDDCLIGDTEDTENSKNLIDCRNYGGIDGIPQMKTLFADLMQVSPQEVLVGGNSSLTLMYDSLVLFALSSAANGKPKILCPAPGYDRHFFMTAALGFDMITIPMTAAGPDITAIRQHITDADVVGIWCVPVYSNPQGLVYSDETIEQLAALKPAAPNFKIFWDNAYITHSFDGTPPKTLNLLRTAQKYDNYDMPLMFTSFSKITFPGAGVAAMAASPNNLAKMRNNISLKTVGPDKINQLRHTKFFPTVADIYLHMKKHGEILSPKFDVVINALTENFGKPDNLTKAQKVRWLKPNGGYFVSVDVLSGCAKRTVELCSAAGLIITPAGATFPHGKDPHDENIRIAPTFPTIPELQKAMSLFCLAVNIATLEKIMNDG
ncbi:MAG: aminotransferase class I/II-fold pyridoxal phosphate-dependent enzyme [Defluviitaleaceae bacterium]|nr:aminotransferase class I/II-fold pyridoxal phosphate-dependent enzyme [Defluviitaleaceae bacterium]